MSIRINKKWLIGRTIVDVDMQPSSDGRGGTMHDPRIELDNGAVLRFGVEETDDYNYGVYIQYIPRKR